MIPVNLFPSCFASLSLWISHQDKVSMPLWRLRYPSHRSWIVLALSMSGCKILSTSVLSLVVSCSYNSTKLMSSLRDIFCRSAILILAQGSRLKAEGSFFSFLMPQALCFKPRKTFRLSFFNFAPLHSGQVLISSMT
jgi:hypothetical protein